MSERRSSGGLSKSVLGRNDAPEAALIIGNVEVDDPRRRRRLPQGGQHLGHRVVHVRAEAKSGPHVPQRRGHSSSILQRR